MKLNTIRLVGTIEAGVLAALLNSPLCGQELIWKQYGTTYFGEFGTSLDVVGDVDGDGVPELVAGAPLDSTVATQAGFACLISGKDGSTVYSYYGGSTNEFFGNTVAGVGDVDGDGVPDFAVGAPLVTRTLTAQGEITVYSGSTGAVIDSVDGSAAGDALGRGLANVGDVNGDQISDFAVNVEASKSALILSGADGSLIWTLTAPKSSVYFGFSLGGGGDVDGDGVPDVIVGDIGSSFLTLGGAACVFSGATGALLHQIGSTRRYADFGKGVSIVGDVDADGFADFLVGAPRDDRVVTGGGFAALYSGKDGSVMRTYTSDDVNLGWLLGYATRGAGDVNGDGVVDYMIGAPALDENSHGAVFVYSGRDGELIYHCMDTAVVVGLGAPIGPVADFDGDGHVDWVCGAPFEDNGTLRVAGSVSIWRGFDFNVDLWPHFAFGGQTVTATLGQGIAGSPYALFLRAINGTPFFTLLQFGALDATGRDVISALVPWPAGTNTIELQAFTLDANGKLEPSGIEQFFTQ